MAIIYQSNKFPIHRISLEGFGAKSLPDTPPKPLPAVEMESTPFGHIKIKIGDGEVVVPGQVLLKAVATLTCDGI